jgi:hypothetical protein
VYADRGEADIPIVIRFILKRVGVTEYLALKPAPVIDRSASRGVAGRRAG